MCWVIEISLCLLIWVLGFYYYYFSELMLLGFISLFLAVTQDYIVKICIPANQADNMLPCRKKAHEDEDAAEDESCSADVCVSVSNRRIERNSGPFNNNF